MTGGNMLGNHDDDDDDDDDTNSGGGSKGGCGHEAEGGLEEVATLGAADNCCT